MIFYPDNPNRRTRAGELQTDLENLKAEYDEVTKANAALFTKARGKLNKILKAMNIDNLDDLGMLLYFFFSIFF